MAIFPIRLPFGRSKESAPRATSFRDVLEAERAAKVFERKAQVAKNKARPTARQLRFINQAEQYLKAAEEARIAVLQKIEEAAAPYRR